MYHSFLIHSSVDGHLGCFHVLAIVNSAAVNNGIHVSVSILVSSRYMPWRRDRLPTPVFLGFPGDSDGKESNEMWVTWVQSLGGEDPLKEGMATHFSILVWRIPKDRGAYWATGHGIVKNQT